MALTVEDGSGKTDADSYLAVADADTYLTANYLAANTKLIAWDAATTAPQEIALRQATQYVDIRYDGNWRGLKFTTTQALAWPRTLAVDNEGDYFDTDEIPQQLKDAIAELALRVIGGDTLLADQAKPASIKSKSVMAGKGAIQTSVEYVGGLSPVKKYPKVENLMKSLVTVSGTLERG